MPIQRRTLSLTESQRQELVKYRDHDARLYVCERCAAILKVADGKAPYWVARQGLLKARDPDTVYSWLRIYQDEGLQGLVSHQQGGAHRRCL